MESEFDPDKDSENVAKHGLSLAEFQGFDDLPAVIADNRLDYGETRYRAFGRIGGKGHMIAYVLRGDHVRLISFRRAHDKEMKRYER